ncbi:MAG TPA: YihY/virulence factor BrkB family protein [Steroidobacteraceae bacterium]|nr:YihY/virulence factor BrkB family protein [Steroidobacteraceae bacterium]
MSATQASRGRSAEQPTDIPAAGWRDILLRVLKNVSRHNLSLVAAGLAMYALLSIFPALTAALSLYGLFITPAHAVQQINSLANMLPAQGWALVSQQLQEVASHTSRTLSVSAGIALLVALWSARSGMSSLIVAMNIAYEEDEKRSWIWQVVLSLFFTLVLLLGMLVLLALGFAIPLVLAILGTSEWVKLTAEVLRWLLIWVFSIIALGLLYRFAPARRQAQWQWVSWGSVIAATLWLIGSLLFSFYLQTFGSYQKTYGAVGSVVVLLMWFYLSSFFLMLGAQINAEMEHQTARDTTDGTPRPMGRRGAYVADTLGQGADSAPGAAGRTPNPS